MNSNKKHFSLKTYISVAKSTYFIAILCLLIFWIVCYFALPSERDIVQTSCRIFESEWTHILPDGEKIAVEIPGTVPAVHGEIVTLSTTLPSQIEIDETICFRPIWQDVDIYIDGELRQHYSTKDSRPFGINSPMRYIFVELNPSDAGKELTYRFSSNSKYAGNMRESYIGDHLSIWLYLAQKSGVRAMTAAFLLLLSLSCILVCTILKFVYKKSLSLQYLAWTIFFCALWMLSEIEFRQLMVKNLSVLSCYAYWSLMLIPPPLLYYINDIQNNRYYKAFLIPITYSFLILIIGTLLQVFNIVQFVQLVPFIHFGLLISILCIIVTITIDTVKINIKEYLSVGIGVYGMMFTAILEMILYHTGSPLSLGTILALGLFFLLIMAIIKTGQDLFSTEKKRQQAIIAREAQAKFLANMSHEIRTPINAIIGMNEMILREHESDAVLEYANNIQSASNMLLGLVNDVLDFSKIESGQLELVEDTYELSSVLQSELLFLTTRVAKKPISSQIIADPDLPSKYFGDELRIKQILTNLISNAVKYTDQGTVTLKVFQKEVTPETTMLCFSVIDTGIGIKNEDLSQLFDSFKRLEITKNRAIQGTGLGLNITKQLVDLMHGEIIVDSVYGKGSTFTVSIPQKIEDASPIGDLNALLDTQKKEKATCTKLFTAPDARILIVDDNSMNLTLMKSLLKRTKMQVDLASGGKECLEITKEKSYHIIFMDHMMPELDGVETLHLLRADASNPNQNALVIALTANAIAGCREMYLEYGFNDYFSKPVQADKLDELIINHLPKELVHMQTSSETINNPDIESPSSKSSEEEKSPAVSELTDIDSDLLTVDRALGLSYCMDSEELYNEVVSIYCSQATDYLPKLEQFFQNHDWENYTVIVHGLKSSSLNIGASNFSKLCLKHELAAKSKDEKFILVDYASYIVTLKALLEKLEGML